MNKDKKPASEETRKTLFENMGKTICTLNPVLKAQIILTEALKDKIENSVLSIEKEKILSVFLPLGNYSQYMNIELLSVLRSCFRAKHLSERRYNLKFINIVILEGYKHLYGYGSIIKKSLWHTVTSLLEIISDEELKSDYLALDKQIKKFGEDAITNKDQRDLGIHYDLDPILVYEMLKELSEEEEVQRVLQFGKLLEMIASFSFKYQSKYYSEVKIDSNIQKKKAFTYIDFDLFREKKEETYLMLEKHIEKQTDNLNYFVRIQEFPSFYKKQFKESDDDFFIHIHQIVDLTKANIQLMFLYIDLASATRAFISSEYEIERRIALKQTIIIIYEGFNKLYDADNTGVETFFRKYIQPIVEKANDEVIHEQFTQLKEELDLFWIEIKKLEKKRHLSVHYDKGVEQVYNMIYDLNPFLEFSHSLHFLNLLEKVLNFSFECLHIIDISQKRFFEKKTAKTNESIDQILTLLEKHSQSSQNDKLIQLLKKLKSGDFFRERFKELDN